MRRTIKDCKVQLEFINKLLSGKVKLEIHTNGIWKNLYNKGDLIVSAETYRELYYHLVSFKRGAELVLQFQD